MTLSGGFSKWIRDCWGGWHLIWPTIILVGRQFIRKLKLHDKDRTGELMQFRLTYNATGIRLHPTEHQREAGKEGGMLTLCVSMCFLRKSVQKIHV